MRLKSLGKQALLVGGLTAVLSGCKGDTSKEDTRTDILIGTPLSVSIAYEHYNGSILAIVLEMGDRKVLASTYIRGSTRKTAETAALIQSEISDGDNEKIELTGKYRENHNSFEIESVRANGYTVDFE